MIKKSQLKKYIVLLLFFLSLFGLAACDTQDELKEYVTLTFANTNLEAIEVEKGSKANMPNDPVKTHHDFDDWYTDETFATPFNFDQVITEDTTIYALFYTQIGYIKEIGKTMAHNEISTAIYYVRGIIDSIANVQYGNLTLSDGSDTVFVYGIQDSDGNRYGNLTQKPVVGDTVFLKGPLKKFNESTELNGTTLIKYEKNTETIDDPEGYQALSIDQARSLEKGEKVIVEGVVAQITYENNNKPNGLYLVDNCNSIYIYSSTIATSVALGNQIRVAGTRANFILESELQAAETFGYQGAIQIDQAILIKNDESSHELDLSWVLESTVKEMLETNHQETNITTTIFKVNAYINKVDGKGFTNYYFNDIDQKTGSYTYSMNSGSDFSWLDAYDGEFRVVYLSIINAKSSPSGIQYRFVPIKIGDIVTYNENYNPEYAVKYVAIDQFKGVYIAGYSPDLVLETSVSSDILPLQNVTLSYASSRTESVYFEEIGGKLIFKTGVEGVSIITITARDGDNTYQASIEVRIENADDAIKHAITVQTAIETEDDHVVLVRGIVGPSLVNQTGFYLIDESGVIAVRMTNDMIKSIAIGNEVVISGTKKHVGNATPDAAVGQIVIDNASVIVNLQGKHAYPTTHFIKDKTLSDVKNLNKLEDHTTEVYIIEATIKYTETAYYSRYELIGEDGVKLSVYSSSGGQLSFLSPYKDQRVTVELMVVNWNGKDYSGSILSIIVDGVRIVSDQNFK